MCVTVLKMNMYQRVRVGSALSTSASLPPWTFVLISLSAAEGPFGLITEFAMPH